MEVDPHCSRIRKLNSMMFLGLRRERGLCWTREIDRCKCWDKRMKRMSNEIQGKGSLLVVSGSREAWEGVNEAALAAARLG